MVASPYDLDVRYSQKRGTEWKGYKVHLSASARATETCEPDRPHPITHVATTAATDQDVTALEGIHDGLAARGLLPSEHLADGAYLSASELVKSRDRYGVEVVGPMRVDASWQAADPDAFEAARFEIDWEAEQVTCPMGERSYKWSPSRPFCRIGTETRGKRLTETWPVTVLPRIQSSVAAVWGRYSEALC